MGRPKANSNFFKTWSDDMAYVLGFIVTDGCLVEHKNGCHALNITNKNKEILKRILNIMDSAHKISIKHRGGMPNLAYFQIQIRDKTIYADLLKLGLVPRKSKIVRMPKVPFKFFGSFIRGCFDGDGSVTIWQDPRWGNPWQIRTVFSSASYIFLLEMQERLHAEVGLGIGSIQRLKGEYELCYSIADSIKLYKYMYKNVGYDLLCLKYKLDKFEFFRKIRQDIFKARGRFKNNKAPSSSLV